MALGYPTLLKLGSLLRCLDWVKCAGEGRFFVGGVLGVVSRFFASVIRAAADWRRYILDLGISRYAVIKN